MLIGQNNTGKTGILEAFCLLFWDFPTLREKLPGLFRPTSGSDKFWDWLFFDKDVSNTVEICAGFEDGKNSSVILEGTSHGSPVSPGLGHTGRFALGEFHLFREPGNSAGLKTSVFSTTPTSPREDAINYNRVVAKRKKKRVEELLRSIEPRLEAIESLQTGTAPLLYADLGLAEMIPITQLGQGFNRVLHLYAELLASESKILLVDEIENGLHHSILPTIWHGIFAIAREMNVQIFATTHSWECILAADAASREHGENDLNLVRLDRVEEEIKATKIEPEALETAQELHWEMR